MAQDGQGFDWIADFAGRLPMDVISEMMGVPGGRPGRGTPPRRPGRAPRGRRPRRAAGRHGGRARPGRLLRRHGRAAEEAADRRPHQRAARRRDRRRQAHRRGDHRLPLPDGGGRQRDHDQAARARAVPPDPAPRPVRPGLRGPGAARRPGRAVDRGDAALRHLQPDGRAAPARRTSSCTARSRRRARSCCSCSARPTATTGSSPTRTATTSSATRTRSPSCSASAAAGTSAWAPTWPGSRRRSRCASWSAGSAGSRSTTTACRRVHSVNVRGFASVPVRDGGPLMPQARPPGPPPGRRHRRLVGHRRGHRAGPRRGRLTRSRWALAAPTSCEDVAAAIRDAGRRGLRPRPRPHRRRLGRDLRREGRPPTSATSRSWSATPAPSVRAPSTRSTPSGSPASSTSTSSAPTGWSARSCPGMVERRAATSSSSPPTSPCGPRPFMSSYAAGKWGLEGMAHAMQMELEGTGVRASIVRPGPHLERDGQRLGRRGRRRRAQPVGALRPRPAPALPQAAPRSREAITTIVSAPRGVHLNLIEVTPEAPVEDR